MPNNPKAIYWDACVFLSYVNDMPERMPTLESLLESAAASNGAAKLYTSTLSHAEVAFSSSEQKQKRLTPEVEERINALWAAPGIVSVEPTEDIARAARSLIRQSMPQGQSLKPLDAIHLATAQWLSSEGFNLDEFHTYDKRLFGYASLIDVPIHEPRVAQPRLIVPA